MNSITNPRIKAGRRKLTVQDMQVGCLTFGFRRCIKQRESLLRKVADLQGTIDFYNVLYPMDCQYETENGLIKINCEVLKRKLGLCMALASMNAIDDLKTELSIIPEDWKPDYLKESPTDFEPVTPQSWKRHVWCISDDGRVWTDGIFQFRQSGGETYDIPDRTRSPDA